MICNLRAAATLIFSFATLVLTSAVAPAALVVEISTSVNGSPFSAFTGASAPVVMEVGQFADVRFQVRLEPEGNSSDGSRFLNSYGLQFDFSSAVPVSSSFNVQSQLFSPSNTANSIVGRSVAGGPRPDILNQNAIFATVRFNAVAAGSTTLSFSDPLLNTDTFSTTETSNLGAAPPALEVSRDGFPLNASVAFTVNPVAVPEPGSLLLICGTLAGLGIRRVRRSHRAVVSV